MVVNAQVEGSGRRYRSKKQRPCDLCRTRKIQCRIQGQEAPCETCKKLERRCTFVSEPLKRHPRPSDADGTMSSGLTGASLSRIDPSLEEDALMTNYDDQVGGYETLRGDALPLPSSVSWLPRSEAEDGNDAPFLSGQTPRILPWDPAVFPSGATPSDGGFRFLGRDLALGPLSVTGNNFLLPPPRDFFPRPDSNHGSSQSHRGSTDVSATGHPSNAFDSSWHYSNPGDAPTDREWPVEWTLDGRQGLSHQLIGFSSESDPYLLRYYSYDQRDTYLMYRLHFRKMTGDCDPMVHPPQGSTSDSISDDTLPPIHFALTNEDIYGDDMKAAEGLCSGGGSEADDMKALRELIPADLGRQLIKLYTRHVHPRLPILALEHLERLKSNDVSAPVGLTSAVYALAAPFTFLDDELSLTKGYLQIPTDELWTIAHRSFQRATRHSHLALLQLCLLLLNMPPRNYAVAEPPSGWVLSCSSLAIAESLGLNIDPSEWRLPKDEVILRRRLWWFTIADHVWQAMFHGRSCHVDEANWSVLSLTLQDFEGQGCNDEKARAVICEHVPLAVAHCELSLIAYDVLRAFYTLRAVRESKSLPSLLQKAQPLRNRIEEWRQTHEVLLKPISELTENEFETGAVLRLSHLTLEILIFRALMRPIVVSHESGDMADPGEPVSTIFDNCFTCAKAGSEIVSALGPQHFANFWPPCVRFQLCYINSFILLNLAQSTSKEIALRNLNLLNRWRDILRTRAQAWPIARLATIRLDAVFWKGVVSVIQGAGKDSPAMALFRDRAS